MADVPRESDSVDWLTPIIANAISRGLCTEIHCTTCGATEFRENVRRGAERIIAGSAPSTYLFEYQRVLAAGLARLDPDPRCECAFEEATRLLIFELFRSLAWRDVKPLLDGTWAGGVLDSMRAHSEGIARGRAARAAFEDPAQVQARRDAARQERAVRHAERLRNQAERSRAWHSEHGDEPPGAAESRQDE